MKAHYVRGLMLEQQGRAEEALEAYNQALEGDPAHLGALDRKGAIHDARGEFEGSLDCARRFIEIDGRNAGAHRNLGLMLREMGKFEEAERSLRAAISLDPGLENAACHLALVLIDQGRLHEAERILSDVLSAAPDHVEGRWTSALFYLQQGRFDVGWDLYESREARRQASQQRGAVPEWDGRSAPDGPLLIYSEQGLGDEIMFASCFNDVLRLAPSCIIECEPRLERLFRRSFPAAAILPGAGARGLPPVAAQIATGSLPRHFRRSWSDFPRHSGYLVPEPAKVAAWRERLRRLGPGLKAGLAWTGGALKTRRRLRSIELRQLLPIVSSDQARFVSLQYVESAAEIAAFNETHGPVIHHWPEAIGDYDETAALVAALDVVISVSTAVVHLAGALGKPVWVMVPAAPRVAIPAARRRDALVSVGEIVAPAAVGRLGARDYRDSRGTRRVSGGMLERPSAGRPFLVVHRRPPVPGVVEHRAGSRVSARRTDGNRHPVTARARRVIARKRLSCVKQITGRSVLKEIGDTCHGDFVESAPNTAHALLNPEFQDLFTAQPI